MITRPNALTALTKTLIDANKADIVRFEFLGGTVALSAEVEAQVRRILE
jgi:hypothetical protein